MLGQEHIVIDMDTHDSEGNVTGSSKATVTREQLESVFNQAARVSLLADSDHSPEREERLLAAVDGLTDIVNETTISSVDKEI